MMSWPLVLGATPYATAAGGDPYWNSVIFYAPFTADLLDHSKTALALSGGGALYADSPSASLGAYSFRPASGSGGYKYGSLSAAFGSGNFTVEFFYRYTSGDIYSGICSIDAVLGSDYPILTIGRYATTINGAAWVSTNGTSWNIVGFAANLPNLCDGSWHHCAIVRDGTTLRGFVDGVQTFTATMSGTYTPKGPYIVVGGKADVLTNARVHNLQHFRVTKGVARYTAAFTPPVLPYPTA